jgi:CRISPR-associated protein Csd1
MLLQKLKEYAERQSIHEDDMEVAPDEYEAKVIPWIIRLSKEGGQPHFIRTSGGRGKKDVGKEFLIPYLKRSGQNTKPQLLADAAESVLGLVAKNMERAQKRHKEFCALVDACAQATQVAQVMAVRSFLRQVSVSELQLPEDLKPTDFITFSVEGINPIDLEDVQRFWAQITPRLGERGLPLLTTELILSWLDSSEEGQLGQCIVCGEFRKVERIHPVAIKLPRNVSDQQLALVTAHKDKDAFHSYGLQESYIAPTCRPCAVDYARAINALAKDEQRHAIIGNSILIAWTCEEVEFDFFASVNNPDQEVMNMIEAIRESLKGKPLPDFNTNAFYATILSASGARVTVRDWIETTLDRVLEQLTRWFRQQRIVDSSGEYIRVFGLRALAAATVRELKDLPTPTIRALFRTALIGTPLPMNLLQQTIQRCRADQDIKTYQAAMLKLVLTNRHYIEEESMERLDPDLSDVAYRCGRLLAVLETIQIRAISGINQTVVSRFLGAAMTTPRRVFTQLVKGAEDHLDKLVRQNQGGMATNFQKQLEEILYGIHEFPLTFTPDQQAMFILGLYHQRANDRAERAERKAANERKQAEKHASNPTESA